MQLTIRTSLTVTSGVADLCSLRTQYHSIIAQRIPSCSPQGFARSTEIYLCNIIFQLSLPLLQNSISLYLKPIQPSISCLLIRFLNTHSETDLLLWRFEIKSICSSLYLLLSSKLIFFSHFHCVVSHTTQPAVGPNVLQLRNKLKDVVISRNLLPHCRLFHVRVSKLRSYIGEELDEEAVIPVRGFLNTLLSGTFFQSIPSQLSCRQPFLLRTRYQLTFSQLMNGGHITMRYKSKGERNWTNLEVEQLPYHDDPISPMSFPLLLRPVKEIPPESQVQVKLQGRNVIFEVKYSF
jgi:hypothetical protein